MLVAKVEDYQHHGLTLTTIFLFRSAGDGNIVLEGGRGVRNNLSGIMYWWKLYYCCSIDNNRNLNNAVLETNMH